MHRLDTSRRLSDYLGSEGKEHVLFETMRKDISVLELAMDTVSVEEFDTELLKFERSKHVSPDYGHIYCWITRYIEWRYKEV